MKTSPVLFSAVDYQGYNDHHRRSATVLSHLRTTSADLNAVRRSLFTKTPWAWSLGQGLKEPRRWLDCAALFDHRLGFYPARGKTLSASGGGTCVFRRDPGSVPPPNESI